MSPKRHGASPRCAALLLFATAMPTRRALLAVLPFAALSSAVLARGMEDALLQGALLRLGVERLAKLSLEKRVLAERASNELVKERARVQDALQRLRDPRALPAGWSGRRAAQVERAVEAASEFANRLDAAPADLLGESEALAARLGFVTTALSGELADPAQGALIDLLARAGTTALRVGKLNFAAALAGKANAEIAVSAQQSLGEFRAALQSIAGQSLPARARQELEQAQNQWLLFHAALREGGLAKDPARLPEIATTTDRIAESLAQLAKRVLA